VARFEPRQARIPFADGQASEARFTYPRGLAVDSAGIIYVADTWNGAVRKLTPEGAAWRVTTIAGHGAPVREALTR
jgi:sugar lactone lactonase YvrE